MSSLLTRHCPGLLVFLLAPQLALAQVGIGTLTPSPQAALDIRATGKGLLIPRMDSVARMLITRPADGLLVFQLDGRAGFWYARNSQWHYLPDKVRSGDNLGSHTATQNLSLNGHLLTGGGTSGLTITTAGQVGVNSLSPTAALDVVGPTALHGSVSTYGATSLFGPANVYGTTNIVGNTTITGNLTAMFNSAVGGSLTVGTDVTVNGQAQVGWVEGAATYTMAPSSQGAFAVDCPPNTRLLGGGGGHRDPTSSQTAIRVNYSGPDPAAPATRWRVLLENTAATTRVVRVYCICARFQ